MEVNRGLEFFSQELVNRTNSEEVKVCAAKPWEHKRQCSSELLFKTNARSTEHHLTPAPRATTALPIPSTRRRRAPRRPLGAAARQGGPGATSARLDPGGTADLKGLPQTVTRGVSSRSPAPLAPTPRHQGAPPPPVAAGRQPPPGAGRGAGRAGREAGGDEGRRVGGAAAVPRDAA